MFRLGSFLGMDLVWWMIFAVFLFWLFVIPYDIPGQRNKRDSALDILKKRFAAGDISADEYKRDSNLLKEDPCNRPHEKKIK